MDRQNRRNPPSRGVNEIVQDTIAAFMAKAAAKGLGLGAEIEPELPEVAVTEPAALAGILAILVENAIAGS